MTVELTGEQEATVLHLSQETGKTPAQLLAQSLAQLEFRDDEEENGLIEARLAEADCDDAEWISHEEVGRRMGLL